jgi:hypothetical protein
VAGHLTINVEPTGREVFSTNASVKMDESGLGLKARAAVLGRSKCFQDYLPLKHRGGSVG